ncbi:hypothetical protein QNM99_24735 [Pseudomonas sp. PCH446]
MFTAMVEQGRRQGHDGQGIKTIIYGDAPIYPTELRNVLLRNNYGELLKTELHLWLKASANDPARPEEHVHGDPAARVPAPPKKGAVSMTQANVASFPETKSQDLQAYVLA